MVKRADPGLKLYEFCANYGRVKPQVASNARESPKQSRSSRAIDRHQGSSLRVCAGSSCRRSSVVSGCVGVSQPDPTGESPVTTAKPPARYGAIVGGRPGGFALPSYTTTG